MSQATSSAVAAVEAPGVAPAVPAPTSAPAVPAVAAAPAPGAPVSTVLGTKTEAAASVVPEKYTYEPPKGVELDTEAVTSFQEVAKAAGAKIVILNAEATPFDEMADAVFREPIGSLLPQLIQSP